MQTKKKREYICSLQLQRPVSNGAGRWDQQRCWAAHCLWNNCTGPCTLSGSLHHPHCPSDFKWDLIIWFSRKYFFSVSWIRYSRVRWAPLATQNKTWEHRIGKGVRAVFLGGIKLSSSSIFLVKLPAWSFIICTQDHYKELSMQFHLSHIKLHFSKWNVSICKDFYIRSVLRIQIYILNMINIDI